MRVEARGLRRVVPGVAAVLAAAACVRAPADPGPPPAFAGEYLLVVTTSSVCRLPLARFEWVLEVTSTGAGQGEGVRATLPAGDDTIDVKLAYADARRTTDVAVNGSVSARGASCGCEDILVNIASNARGDVSPGAAGRGQVLNGILNGTVALGHEGEREPDGVGSCTAADHHWTLTPR